MLHGRAKPRGDQERTKLIAVQAGGVRLVIQSRPPHMRRGRVIEEFFLDGVAVEPGHRAQAPGNGGPGPPAGVQVAGEELDISAPGLEEAQLVLLGTSWRTAAGPARTPAGSGRCTRQEPG